MSYQVIARKWRPQNFNDMVGQDTVARTLQNALKSGRIAHAFLFSGVRGVGKTTTARILAKALNCHEGVSENPCGECVSCEEITAGNSVDVQEIDAASNRGIDNIRDLRESARYGTARDRFKIYIVDEVHMLTNEAFNALLKTLEEPPAHVKFILATTEYHKIPTTITSRCQKYEFKPMPFAAIFDRLKLITESEGVKISDYALGAVTSVAQGSMRDAQSALDQLIAFGGAEIHDEDVRALLGIVDQKVVWDLVDSVAERDREKLITGMHDLIGTGLSPQLLCTKLVEHVRNLMVCRAVGWKPALLQVPDSEQEALLSQAQRFSELDLIRFYDLLDRVAGELKWHTHPNVHLEISLLKLVELAKLSTIEEVIGALKGGGSLGPAKAFSGGNTPRSSPIDPGSAFQPPSGTRGPAASTPSSGPASRANPPSGSSSPSPSVPSPGGFSFEPPNSGGSHTTSASPQAKPLAGPEAEPAAVTPRAPVPQPPWESEQSSDQGGASEEEGESDSPEGVAELLQAAVVPEAGRYAETNAPSEDEFDDEDELEAEVEDREAPPETARPGPTLKPVTNFSGTDVVTKLMRSLNDNFKSLYGQLACASQIAFRDGRLEISFPKAQSFHASMLGTEDNQKRLSEALARIIGTEVEIGVSIEQPTGKESAPVDPTEDPKVKSFLSRFPGKVIVKREYEN